MKLAILGAPGSGKSEFAIALATELADDFEIIDDLVEDLREMTRLEYGPFGTHIDDIQVAFKRRELELILSDFNTISVGTILDSTVHCFTRVEETARSRKEIGLQAERLNAIAGTFGLLYTDTWDYDYAFMLRYEGDDRHSRMIDIGLVDLISVYEAPILTFKSEVSYDEKASTAARAIAALEAKQLSETSKRGVRSGSEASVEDGNSSEPVPDVFEQGRASDDA